MEYSLIELGHGLHEPIIYVQTENGLIQVSLCDDCNTCQNTACYDIPKLRKYLDETRGVDMTVENNNRCNHGPGLCLNVECTDLCPVNPGSWDAAKKVRGRLTL